MAWAARNRAGAGDSGPGFLTSVNGTLFFAATDGVSGFELWTSDGTDGGTYRGTITMPNDNSLRLRGCIVAPLCKTQTWTRIQ